MTNIELVRKAIDVNNQLTKLLEKLQVLPDAQAAGFRMELDNLDGYAANAIQAVEDELRAIVTRAQESECFDPGL